MSDAILGAGDVTPYIRTSKISILTGLIFLLGKENKHISIHTISGSGIGKNEVGKRDRLVRCYYFTKGAWKLKGSLSK